MHDAATQPCRRKTADLEGLISRTRGIDLPCGGSSSISWAKVEILRVLHDQQSWADRANPYQLDRFQYDRETAAEVLRSED
jgi:hypothetical protein